MKGNNNDNDQGSSSSSYSSSSFSSPKNWRRIIMGLIVLSVSVGLGLVYYFKYIKVETGVAKRIADSIPDEVIKNNKVWFVLLIVFGILSGLSLLIFGSFTGLTSRVFISGRIHSLKDFLDDEDKFKNLEAMATSNWDAVGRVDRGRVLRRIQFIKRSDWKVKNARDKIDSMEARIIQVENAPEIEDKDKEDMIKRLEESIESNKAFIEERLEEVQKSATEIQEIAINATEIQKMRAEGVNAVTSLKQRKKRKIKRD